MVSNHSILYGKEEKKWTAELSSKKTKSENQKTYSRSKFYSRIFRINKKIKINPRVPPIN